MILKGVTFPTKPSSDGYFHVYIKYEGKRRAIKDKTLEGLKRKYIEKYKSLHTKSFKEVFMLMCEEKLFRIRDEQKRHSTKNTIARYNSDYRRFFVGSDLESMAIDKVTVKDIEAFVESCLNYHNLRRQGFMNIRTILNKTYQYAYKHEMADNVTSRVDFKQFESMLIPSVKISERLHSDEEIEAMLSFIREYNGGRGCLGRFALELQLLTGSREGEIPPLRWSDISCGCINITREQLTVREEARQYSVIVEHTKTSTDRRFPVTGEIKEYFNRLREYHKKRGIASEYLFPSKDGVIANHTIYTFYKNMCDKLEIPICADRKKGPHSFRRNHITKTINASNGNIMMAAKLYGNSVETIQKNYYDSLDMDEARKVLESW